MGSRLFEKEKEDPLRWQILTEGGKREGGKEGGCDFCIPQIGGKGGKEKGACFASSRGQPPGREKKREERAAPAPSPSKWEKIGRGEAQALTFRKGS